MTVYAALWFQLAMHTVWRSSILLAGQNDRGPSRMPCSTSE